MILNKNDINEFFQLINISKNICIVGHTAPDGDCIGSVMALYNYIKTQLNKDAVPCFEGKIPFNYEHYIDNSIIRKTYIDDGFDLVIILDCSDKERLGTFNRYITANTKTVCIDHHKTNTQFADINIIDSNISSTGELLYNIFKEANKNITKKMAEYIYISIITDTGKFSYSSTSSNTHLVAADLINKGIDVSKINNDIYNSKPANVIKAYIECISNIKLFYNNKLGITTITKSIIDKNNIDMNDIDGVVEFIREINEVEISCVLKEYDTNETKVSLRSKHDIDVAKVSQKFSGGGHAKAAGFMIHDNINNSINIVVDEFNKILGD